MCVCKRRKLNANLGKSKVVWCTREAAIRMNIRLNGEALQKVAGLKFCGYTVVVDGVVTEARAHRVNDAG